MEINTDGQRGGASTSPGKQARVPTSHTKIGRVPTSHTKIGSVPTSHTKSGIAPTSHTKSGIAPTSHTKIGSVPTSHTKSGIAPTSHTKSGRVPTSPTETGRASITQQPRATHRQGAPVSGSSHQSYPIFPAHPESSNTMDSAQPGQRLRSCNVSGETTHDMAGPSHRSDSSVIDDVREIDYVENFRGRHVIKKYSAPQLCEQDLGMYLHTYRNYFLRQLNGMYTASPLAVSLRIHPIVVIKSLRQNITGENEHGQFVINLPFEIVTEEEISETFDRWVEALLQRLENDLQEREGSGWVIERIESFSLEYVKVELKVQLGTYVDYPKKLRGRGYIFNPNFNDGLCVLRAFAAYNCSRKMKWSHIPKSVKTKEGCLNHAKSSIDDFPIRHDKLTLLENENRVSLFVYKLRHDKDGSFVSMCRRGNKKYKDNIMCTLLMNENHLVLIKDFDDYVRTIMHERGDVKKHCHSCLMKLNTQKELNLHEEGCKINQTLVFPPEGQTVRFKNYSHTHSSEYIGFFDLECALDNSSPAGNIEARHKAIAYCYVIFDRRDQIVHVESYRGMMLPMISF
nr:uncharacterized protein LOC128703146 [Cherax quadricarinatus]